MGRRAQLDHYSKIEKVDDLEQVVRDKTTGKRASKEKARRRNRHYEKTLLRYLTKDTNDSK